MEDYKKILAISGKPGLYKLIGQMKSGIIAESLDDGKRFPVYVSENISSLDDISIYTEEGEFPLKDVFKNIYSKEGGKKVSIDLNDQNELKKYFESLLPNYDKSKVYTSDMKKALKWFNILLDKKMLIIEEEKEKEPKKTASKSKSTKKSEASTEEIETKKDTEKPKKTKKVSDAQANKVKTTATKNTVKKVAPKAPPKKVTTPRKAS